MEQEYGPSPNLYFYRAECYSYLGDMDSAIEDIAVLIDTYDDASYRLYVTRADYYRLAGRYEEAIADMTRAIDIDPSIVFGYYKRGWCYELMRDDDSAMADYNLGIDIDINESYPYIYLMRGEQYLKRGDMASATADFEKVLELDTVADGGSCRQYALQLLGRDQEAIEWMNEVIALDPEDMGSYYDQACLYSRMGRAEEAISALRKALEKGYRSFAHIEFDDYLDAVREFPEFKALIEEYKGKIVCYKEVAEDSVSDTIQTVSEVQMTRMRSGLYEVPCTINNLPLKFILDTGASTVTISSVEASFMLKNGYLTESDIRGKHYYSTASGEIREGTIICLREVKIGDAVLRNIEASVTHSQSAPLLLGQSVMERFGVIAIDTATSMLTITQK
jgi:clan AA aspartic protease (TIGR02281 family)